MEALGKNPSCSLVSSHLPRFRPGEDTVYSFSSLWSLGSPDNQTYLRASNIIPSLPHLEIHALVAWAFGTTHFILILSLELSCPGYKAWPVYPGKSSTHVLPARTSKGSQPHLPQLSASEADQISVDTISSTSSLQNSNFNVFWGFFGF